MLVGLCGENTFWSHSHVTGVNGTVCIQRVAINSTSTGQFAHRVSWNILNYGLTLPMGVLHPGSAENEHAGLQTSLLHRICLF